MLSKLKQAKIYILWRYHRSNNFIIQMGNRPSYSQSALHNLCVIPSHLHYTTTQIRAYHPRLPSDLLPLHLLAATGGYCTDTVTSCKPISYYMYNSATSKKFPSGATQKGRKSTKISYTSTLSPHPSPQIPATHLHFSEGRAFRAETTSSKVPSCQIVFHELITPPCRWHC